MTMQKGYEWLLKEPGPKMLTAMIGIFGTLEKPGAADNPVILGWAREVGIWGYRHDSVPWCGLAMAVAAKRGGWNCNPKGNALWALNWASWGTARTGPAMLGDVLVKNRDGGGHVTMYVGEDDACYHCMGGNQSDQVNIERIPKTDFLAVRHAPWKVQPDNVRRVFLDPAGAPVSTKQS